MENSGVIKKSGIQNWKNYRVNPKEQPKRSLNKDYNKSSSRKSNERKYPIGIKELERLLEYESHIIPVTLLRDGSGYRLLLDQLSIRKESLCLVIKAIHKSLDIKVFVEGIRDLLLLTFTNSKFLQNLNQFISNTKYELENMLEYVPLVCEVIDKFLTLSPVNAFPVASGFVDTCMGIIKQIKLENIVDVGNVEQSLQLLQLKVKESRESYVRFKNKEEAPNDFRELDIVPTSAELNAVRRPFIRPNIIDGSYENADHYLDVQFRLLKEDFMRPLREGLQHYRSAYSRNSDVRVYPNFTLHSTSIEQTELVHFFRVNTKRNIGFNSSKRFMFGNIICISDDNFNTVITASVFNTDKLNVNIVGVKLEADSDIIQYDKKYVAIESKAYFVAYKHTLRALQILKEIPFENYFVYVKEEEKEPEYIRKPNNLYLAYNIRMATNNYEHFSFSSSNNASNSIEAIYGSLKQSKLLFKSEESLEIEDLIPELKFSEERENFTSESKYDESQLRALHAALNRQLAIIQGPPGTGKTFLGLEITKILLKNKRLWSENNAHPILVVCYTNHALDQFLEGITNFTEKIIRSGSRSKNEKLHKYEIKNCLFKSKGKRDDDQINKAYHEIRLEIRNFRIKLNFVAGRIINFSDSIIDFASFNKDFCIIPPRIADALKKMDMKLFLKEKFIYKKSSEDMNKFFKLSSQENLESDNDQSLSVLNQIFQEENDLENNYLEELIKQEETERILDYDDDDSEEEDFDNEDEIFYQDDIYIPYFNTLLNKNELHAELKELYSSKDISFRERKKIVAVIRTECEILKNINEVLVNEYECIALENTSNIYNLDFDNRVKLYCYWRDKLRVIHEDIKRKMEKKFMNLHKRLSSIRQLAYLSQMKKADIVGMTTTGAAQFCDLLHDLAPPIVIIEEAAEILEAHVISSLSSKCQHLILIGDHKQLRPKPTVYELGVKYNLDTSLFERLINNGIKYETLEYQHRMKPIISDLLVPTFYETLKDHPSVLQYPKIKGIKEDLFFINHNHHESKPSNDMESYENVHEAKFLLGLARHLVYQGYTHEDITIITPYSGQYRCLRELQRQEESSIQNIPINILDNFQGEESNIILLSLVRSNEEEKVGFMKIDNRICVAISRAKHGMYIIGNMNQMIKSSSIWSQINEKLLAKNYIGYNFHLECQNHPNSSITVNTYEEFTVESPEGGCNQPCSKFFPKCEHACPRHCHPDDPDHRIAKCEMLCPKYLCEYNHVKCPKLCSEECPECDGFVEKKFPCGHSHTIQCSLDPNTIKCDTIIDKVLDCNHLAKNFRCHEDVSEYICKKKCLKILKCGHPCQKRCHKKQPLPPLFIIDLEEWESCQECQMLVEKELPCGHKLEMKCYLDPKDFECHTKLNKELPCGHEVNIECHIDVTSHKCPFPCSDTLTCGHPCGQLCHRFTDPNHENYSCISKCLKFPLNCVLHKCRKLCYEDCGGCTEMIDFNLNCGHVIKAECSSEIDKIKCLNKCQQILPCGHPCPKLCGETCGGCIILQEKIIPDCLHSDMVPCGEYPSITYCTKPCRKRLSCGHECQEKCKDECTKKCEVMCASSKKCPRDHTLYNPCHMNHSTFLQINSHFIYECESCVEVCGLQLDCKHLCKGKCGECFSGRLHVPCTNICQKILPCGHECKASCSIDCPPCRENCLWKCIHTECKEKCGDKCSICFEKCPNFCEHSVCNSKCGYKCTRKPCKLPCKQKVTKCDHPCIGFCGEPCPPLCRICDADLIEELLFDDVSIENARFIMLEDCKHVFEATFLDNWMYTKFGRDTDRRMKMKLCPECNIPIYNTRRYRSLIMDIYKGVFSTRRTTRRRELNQPWFRKELMGLMLFYPDEATLIRENLGFDHQLSISGKERSMDSSLLDLYFFQVSFLKFSSRMKEKMGHQNNFKLLINTAMTYKGKITPEKRDHFFFEIKRLKCLDSVSHLKSVPRPGISTMITTIENLMNPTVMFSEEIQKQVQERLDEAFKIVNPRRGIMNRRQRGVRGYFPMHRGTGFRRF